jgi:DNA-binding transcriptional LysR family regulator
MDLLQLKYFLAVARLENVTRAAEELHIAQPSLSKTIARLEQDLGLPLFERSGKRIRLNLFGRTFLERVERSFSELEAGRRELADLAGLERGQVTVGASSSRLMPDLLNKYLTERPHLKFGLRHYAKQQEMQERLLKGDIDFSIFFLPIGHPDIHSEPLIIEEIFLAVPTGHRLAGRRSIKLKEAASESFINYTTDSELWQITNGFCLQAGFTPTVVFEIESIDVTYSLVQAGLGVAFIPAYWRQEDTGGSPVKLHVQEPACRRTIWLSWVKDRYMTRAADDFRRFVLGYFRTAERKKSGASRRDA